MPKSMKASPRKRDPLKSRGNDVDILDLDHQVVKPLFTPTDEQHAILQFASKLKKKRKNKGELVRIIAGAGTGKTTTLKLLSEQLLKGQNMKILYLVFNKQAQADANDRFKNLSGTGTIDCKTMHGAALQGLQKISSDDRPPLSICTDPELQRKIQELFTNRITRWLGENGVFSANKGKKEMAAFDFKVQLAAFYIFKTLESFYRSSEPLESLTGSDKLTYYVAKAKHQEKIGFPDAGQFYSSAAAEVWQMMSSFQTPICHDAYLKMVQLRSFVFGNYNVLLVDESQDLTACQLDLFVHQQIKNSKHVFLVGDACQTIYSFRGARSKFIAQLEDTRDFKLTTSFRFGAHISFVANTFLWIKEKSPQLQMFIPYRLVGKSSNPGLVQGFSDEQRLLYPYTVVARQNATLITKALALLQLDPTVRICLNGGTLGFSQMIEQTLDLYRLCSGQRPHSSKFSSFESFEAFKTSAKELEQSQDLVLISLVESLGDELPSKIVQFKESVLKKAVLCTEIYDVLLSTTHQAKGLEWDRVEVEADFIELDVQKKAPPQLSSIIGFESMPLPNPNKVEFEFALAPYGDDLNLWYVAITRARKELLLPSRYWALIELMYKVKTNKPIMVSDEDGSEKLRFKKEELEAVKSLFSTFSNVL